LLALLLALICSPGVIAQDAPAKKKAATKKSAAKKPVPKPGARQQPTPEQIRKFNELQKKQ
jgi:hypothetical protein